jgi:hypothetical protein
MTHFEKKNFHPLLSQPNLTRPEKGCLSAWILDSDFFQKYF